MLTVICPSEHLAFVDWDVLLPGILSDCLEACAGLPRGELLAHSLLRAREDMAAPWPARWHRWWRVPEYRQSGNGISTFSRRRRVCVQCLAADGIFRIEWSLSSHTVCARHRCLLVESCTQCCEQLSSLSHAPQRMRSSMINCCTCSSGLADSRNATDLDGLIWFQRYFGAFVDSAATSPKTPPILHSLKAVVELLILSEKASDREDLHHWLAAGITPGSDRFPDFPVQERARILRWISAVAVRHQEAFTDVLTRLARLAFAKPYTWPFFDPSLPTVDSRYNEALSECCRDFLRLVWATEPAGWTNPRKRTYAAPTSMRPQTALFNDALEAPHSISK